MVHISAQIVYVGESNFINLCLRGHFPNCKREVSFLRYGQKFDIGGKQNIEYSVKSREETGFSHNYVQEAGGDRKTERKTCTTDGSSRRYGA